MRWFINCLKKYAVFEGRSHRTEYWMFVLIEFVLMIVLSLIGLDLLGTLTTLALIIPGLAVSVRRLHDINKSGWWFLIYLIPLIGFIMWIVFSVRKSDVGANRFGEPQSY